MSSARKVLLISLGHPELILGGSPVVCQELFDEFRTRDDIECTMLAAVDREAGDVHRPHAGITGFDGPMMIARAAASAASTAGEALASAAPANSTSSIGAFARRRIMNSCRATQLPAVRIRVRTG